MFLRVASVSIIVLMSIVLFQPVIKTVAVGPVNQILFFSSAVSLINHQPVPIVL